MYSVVRVASVVAIAVAVVIVITIAVVIVITIAIRVTEIASLFLISSHPPYYPD